MSDEMHAAKHALRIAAQTRRDALTDARVAEYGAAMTEQVAALDAYARATLVAGYVAIGHEAPTGAILRHALAAGKTLALPRVLREERRLVLHRVTDLDALIPGGYGIPEPTPDLPIIPPSEIECFLVPGLAFDARGNRLGHGAGYYDGMLARGAGWRVALAFTTQLTAAVPAAAHDQPMDSIVTERGIIDCRRARHAVDRIRLHGIALRGYHGALPRERAEGVDLRIDAELHLDLQAPALTDALDTTVDYPAVYRLIDAVQSARSYQLLEALAGDIIRAILATFPAVDAVTLRVGKCRPPVGGEADAFEVEVTRARAAESPG